CVERANSGGMLTVAEIQRAYEEPIGRQVAPSTVYRLLDRHGWRNVAPRPRYPDADEAARGAFEETAPGGMPRGPTPGPAGASAAVDVPRRRPLRLDGPARRCWAPRGSRPVVGARLARKYIYAFSAISPYGGVLDSLVLPVGRRRDDVAVLGGG